MSRKNSTVKIRFGHLEFVKLNADDRDIRDVYHWTLTLTWPQFAALVFSAYLTVNLLFSVIYWLGQPCIEGATSFSDAFFFSVETFATVGYGHFFPNTLYGHIVSTVEIMVGLFGMAVITGLIFIRFSRPVARIVFSHNLVVAPFDGKPALMLRVANLRHHAMVEAEFRMMLILDQPVKEGGAFRRFYPLPLQFERLIAFPVALTIRHVIDEKSPLHGMTAADLERTDARILASIVCIDSVIPAPVQSQQDYIWSDILFGKRFVEIYADLDAHRMSVDYGRLHDVEDIPAPEKAPTAG
ncbi:MAG TPA: ion channel [Candidatus Methylacidiphilales bacterium]|jgi:inward rectifier potassium channel|nr:ion channel [Candidatus Methylacidiphilales bacterium]